MGDLSAALRTLQERGRIRSAWLPGMRDGAGNRYVGLGASARWVEVVFEGITNNGLTFHSLDEMRLESAPETHPDDDVFGLTIDLSDPATVGCLLALWHEAGARVLHEADRGMLVDSLFDELCDCTPFTLDDEAMARLGAAIAAALIALAEAP